MGTFTCNNTADTCAHFPVYFYTACDCYEQETVRRPNGISHFHQLLFILGGTGMLKHGTNSYELKRGSAFFTASGVPTEYINTGGLTSAFLTVKGGALDDIMRCYGCDGFLYYESVNTEKYVFEIKRLLERYYTDKRDGVLSAMAYSLLISFFEEGQVGHDSLDGVVSYIERNFSKHLTLSELAGVAKASVSTLSHGFKEKYGSSVFECILDLRLTYASELLLSNPNMMTKQVALSCGFEDVSYFCRAYKKKFGKTPSGTKGQLGE